jgi:hypothetical protein
MTFRIVIPLCLLLSMIFSENRYTLFRIMLYYMAAAAGSGKPARCFITREYTLFRSLFGAPHALRQA